MNLFYCFQKMLSFIKAIADVNLRSLKLVNLLGILLGNLISLKFAIKTK